MTTSDVAFPDDLTVALSRVFDAPIQQVYDVLWRPEHLRKTIAPFGEEVTRLDVDLREGGDYVFAFLPDDGPECVFHGRFLEVDGPAHTRQTWHFEGWPDVEAVETFDLAEADGGTRVTWTLAFADQAGRDHMKHYDGIEANFDNLEKYLATLP